MQVFEYLTTDLKKYMDRNGKGPNFPLTKPVIKVRACVQHMKLAYTTAAPHPRCLLGMYWPLP